MNTEANSILRIEELVVHFGRREERVAVINGINLNLNKGRVLGLVGESGCGKSVTSLAIMGLLAPDDSEIGGKIIFDGQELTSLSREQMAKIRGNSIAMVFQEPMTSLNPVLTCGFQVMESLIINEKISKNEAHKRTIKLFNEVELPSPEETFNKYPHQISGGQKQRVMIAMAISCNPKILIADEPTTALDVIVQKNILMLLKKLQEKYGMSIIFITHDLGIVAEIADKALVMYKGKIVEQGNTKDIMKNPQHLYTKGLLSCRPSMLYRQKRLTTVSDSMKIDEANQFVYNDDIIKQIIVTDDERKHTHDLIYSTEPILTVNNLEVSFTTKRNFLGKPINTFTAVNKLSFNVYKGETLGLVGGSGCGKTTLGRAILKLVESNRGDIIYKGKNLNTISKTDMRKMRKNIQIIFQDPYSSLNPRFTIGQIITEPMYVHKLFKSKKEREARAIELLNKVNLNESHFNRYPHEFSGGQRQRIGIARALALNPEFIICDESVSALDVSIQAQILNLLNDLKEEFDLTYIFISHDLSVVKYMSDRIIVMNHGDIEEIEEADKMYSNPQSDYTKTLINSIPKIAEV